MSTKIHNGYRLRNVTTFELNQFNLEIKERLYDKYEKKYSATLVAMAVAKVNHLIYQNYLLETVKDEEKKQDIYNKLNNYLLDLYKSGVMSIGKHTKDFFEYGKEDFELSMDEILKSFETKFFGSIGNLCHNEIYNKCKMIDITKENDIDYDFISEYCLIPTEEYTYLLAYGHKLEQVLNEIVNSKKKKDRDFVKRFGLEYYGYWNNCDKPKNRTKREWEEMEDNWNTVLNHSAPCEVGITINIENYDRFFAERMIKHKKRMEECLPQKEFCVENMAKTLVKDNYVEKYMLDNKKEEECSIYDTMHLFYDANDAFAEELNNSDKIQKEIEEKKEIFANILPEYTYDVLTNTCVSYIPEFMKMYNAQR